MTKLENGLPIIKTGNYEIDNSDYMQKIGIDIVKCHLNKKHLKIWTTHRDPSYYSKWLLHINRWTIGFAQSWLFGDWCFILKWRGWGID